MLKRFAIAASAVVLAASQTGGCGSGSHATTVGASPAQVTCTEQPDGSPSGITIEAGQVVGTMTIQCTGGSPDSYDFRMILVHDRVMLQQSGNTPVTDPPVGAPVDVSVFDQCSPGLWHIYYLVTWTLDGATVHNTTTTTSDRQVVLDDC
jgi:hypothetical protein